MTKTFPTEREMLEKAVFLLQEHGIIKNRYSFGFYGLGPHCGDVHNDVLAMNTPGLELGLELRVKAMIAFTSHLRPPQSKEWLDKTIKELSLGYPLDRLNLG